MDWWDVGGVTNFSIEDFGLETWELTNLLILLIQGHDHSNFIDFDFELNSQQIGQLFSGLHRIVFEYHLKLIKYLSVTEILFDNPVMFNF